MSMSDTTKTELKVGCQTYTWEMLGDGWQGTADDLLDAWQALRTRVPGWQLLIIGDGPQRAELQAMADASPAAASITLAGALDDADLLAAYRRDRKSVV